MFVSTTALKPTGADMGHFFIAGLESRRPTGADLFSAFCSFCVRHIRFFFCVPNVFQKW